MHISLGIILLNVFFSSSLILRSKGAELEVTVKLHERYLLACSAVSDPENVKHIGWYRCSKIDCEQHWDEFLIAHVQNMTETIPNNPNFEVYTNGTLVIKKVLPVDDGKIFICVAEERHIGRKRSTTILHIEKGAELHVTVKLHERHLLACSSFRNPENVKHIGWYRCSSHDCEHDWDRFLIAHVQNMTETIPNDPNFEVYTNGTLVIKKVLPVDDGKMFICVAEERHIGRKRSTTILHVDEGQPMRTTTGLDIQTLSSSPTSALDIQTPSSSLTSDIQSPSSPPTSDIPTLSSSLTPGSSTLPGGVIAAIVVCCLIAIGVIGLLIKKCISKRKKRQAVLETSIQWTGKM